MQSLTVILGTVVIFCVGQAQAQTPDIFTIAGSGDAGYAGDGSAAVDPAVRLNQPAGVVKDPTTGILYFTDSQNHVIRQVAADGTISTIAGLGGTFGFVDGPAADARFNVPFGIELDAAGNNLLIADFQNNRIRKLDLTTMQVSTIAGDGEPGGGSGASPAQIGDGGDPLAARFNQPIDVAVDAAGAIYIVDRRHHRIRKIENGIVTTVVGSGVAGFSGDGLLAVDAELRLPQGVFVDTNGDIYVADTNNHVVRRVDNATGNIDTVAGLRTSPTSTQAGYSGDGELATVARLREPRAIEIDGSGNIYVADTLNHRVRMFTLGGNIDTVAGSGADGESNGDFNGEGAAATDSVFDFVADVYLDVSDNLIIVDQQNNRIRQTFSPPTFNEAPSDIDFDEDDKANFPILVSGGTNVRAGALVVTDADDTDHSIDFARGKGELNNPDFNLTANGVLRVKDPRLTYGALEVRVVADDGSDVPPPVGAANGATLHKRLLVEVVDDMPPVISLVGDNPLVLNVGDVYTEPGATALDNEVTALDSADIVIDSSGVNTSAVGDYEVTYDVTDASGNAATTVIRTVSVVSADTTPPVITLLGDNPLLLLVGDTFVDPGATAVDDVDGDITANIVVGGDVVNTNVEGNYTVTYTVSDASGNPAQEARTVTVSAEPPPPPASSDMSVDGSGPASVETGSTATYTVSVTNGGPDDATGVTATIGVPTDLISVDSVSAGQGTCAVSGATITCDLGDLANAASVDITVNVTASDSEGSGSATIDVSSDNDDADTSNNG